MQWSLEYLADFIGGLEIGERGYTVVLVALHLRCSASSWSCERGSFTHWAAVWRRCCPVAAADQCDKDFWTFQSSSLNKLI